LILYTLVLCLLFVYILVKNRKIDLFVLALASYFLFTFSLLFGVLPGPKSYPDRVVEDAVYLAFFSLGVALLVGVVVNDYISRVFNFRESLSQTDESFVFSVWCVWLFLLLFLFFRHGSGLLVGMSKRELMDAGGLEIVFFNVISIFVISLSIIRSRFIGFGGAVVVSFVLVFGHRAPVVIGGIVGVLFRLSLRPKGRLYKKITLLNVAGVVLGVLLAVMMKPIIATVKSGDVESLQRRYESSSFELLYAGAEFMRTQYIFNEIVRTDFSTDGGHIVRAPASLLPIPRSAWTTPSSEFNDLYQPVIFPDVRGGMAYNLMAEFYAAYGGGGVIIGSTFVAVAISFFNLMFFCVTKNHSRVFLLLLGTFWAFYSYRNSLATTFAYMRNFSIIFIVCVSLSLMVPKKNRG